MFFNFIEVLLSSQSEKRRELIAITSKDLSNLYLIFYIYNIAVVV